MTLTEILLLYAGGLLAGVINVIVGGAGFLTFPLLLAAGMTEIEANASNFVAVLPANLVGTWVYRHEMKVIPHLPLRLGLAATGGLLGAVLLITTGEQSFQAAIPWLLLFATTSFAVGPTIRAGVERLGSFDRGRWLGLQLALEFGVYVYSGYFGLGMGIILFAIYGVFTTMTIHEGNAVRNITTSVSSLVAIGLFIRGGLIDWGPALIMMAGAVCGGYVAVKVARSIPAVVVRRSILVWAVVLTAVAFWRYL
ncbi:sulfite exporter TauE/SafE family protein [Stagnihabitans tardus]|uniref:Probable membrane transporter protein n=1 Tax=Stagnihabitans tardus TaxID=2699202 RepID=A0AAE4Y8I4_9RHOB|nr:sulfite exporter TauE/SafE family protein [Stagnihabitans tardus]NBZ87898.1 TSUP family transporter [Stagnihabitans tardus]